MQLYIIYTQINFFSDECRQKTPIVIPENVDKKFRKVLQLYEIIRKPYIFCLHCKLYIYILKSQQKSIHNERYFTAKVWKK